MSKPFLLLVLLLTCLPLSLDAEAPAAPKVVVLELRPENKAIALDSAVVVTDIVRTRLVIDAGSALRVLSKEKVFEILQQSGKSAASCTADCQIQTAREVGAEYIVTGTIAKAGKRLVMTLEAKRSRDGAVLAAAQVMAPDEDALMGATAKGADELVADLLKKLAPDAAKADEKPSVRPNVGVGAKLADGNSAQTGDAGLGDLDMDELEQAEALKKAIDVAKAAQGNDNLASEQKAAAWDAVAKLDVKGKNPYRAEAQQHAKEWRDLAGARTRMAADWDKLQRMLKLEVVDIADKKKAVARFLAAYAWLGSEAAVQGAKAAKVALDQGKALPLGGDVPAGMVLIPAGTFWMGCNATKDRGCQGNEKPQHKVTLPAYYMDLTETTVGQYKACVDAGACTVPSSMQPAQYATYPGLTTNPVNFVNWTQSQAYCQWRGTGFDLPTEAQWEMAARGSCEKNGSTAGAAGCAAAMRTYPWGEAAATASHAVMTGSGGTAPAGSIPAGDSPYGLHDMAGNVWEWNRDWHSSTYYSSSPATEPFNSAGASSRVNRGGGFDGDAANLRAGHRNHDDPSGAYDGLGLRCMRSSP